ncbi:MAG: uracil-DNA glycosylase [Candidatus Nanopelagicales bacterium]|nr:uracil-DNA glycosylase [Candidatus Nanopelagicales bacterium]
MLFPIESAVHPSWLPAFDALSEGISSIRGFLDAETKSGRNWLPAPENVLRAFAQPLDRVKVVILGQDPYPTPGHSIGLAFSVALGVALPRSLSNIFSELQSDLGVNAPISGDLTSWSRQGVLLLNSVLTVQSGVTGSHRGKGWEQVTGAALSALKGRPGGAPVAILWGKAAQECGGDFDPRGVISSAHPSPLSAHRGFWGSKPFSRANDLLIQSGISPIEWELA